MSDHQKDAVLVLEDGTSFQGIGFGADKTSFGEVVFNTGMVGYPESLTDPSYYGQILVQTWPLVGSYGVPSREIRDEFGLPLHYESRRIQVKGYVISELQRSPSHWASVERLEDWMKEDAVPGIEGIDTRALTKKLRLEGTMLGLLAVSDGVDIAELKKQLKRVKNPNSTDLVKHVSTRKSLRLNPTGSPKIALIDCGTKYGILRNLLSKGASVVELPYDSSVEAIRGERPSGVVVSNGPGDPKKCTRTIATLSDLLQTELPMLGICLGTQLLGLAAGGDTYKLKFGHRAQNHPCLDLRTKRVYLTTQNHGYSVDAESLRDFEVTFTNLNDGTVEGIRHKTKAVTGVQYHPEASPGPYDTGFLFDDFLQKAREFQSVKA